MNNYKKGFLAFTIVAAMATLAASSDERIFVNTFADEDGENSNACSLREAIKTAAQNKPFGGCTVGKTQSSVTDVIMLEKGEYVLTKPLTPSSQINIYGAQISDWSQKDAITGDYPARLAPATTIKGTDQFPLFDTSVGKGTITLNNLILTNGGGLKGGAILAGAGTYLNTVHVRENKTSDNGGAIYLAGLGTNFEANSSVFENNFSTKNAVLGMTCVDNLAFTERTVKFTNSSLIKNGDSNSKNIIEICGQTTFQMTNNTIAENVANASSGSIIKFTGDSLPNTQQVSILSNSSSLDLLNNTIVNNKAFSTILYDGIGNKNLNYNILAYNQGLSCRYLLGELGENKTYNFDANNNGLIQSKTKEGFCNIRYGEKEANSNVDLSTISQSSILSALQKADKYTAYLPMYFLLGSNNPLANVEKGEACSKDDQRGKTRLSAVDIIYDSDNKNTCDIGATEQSKLRASDVTSTNTSQTNMISAFEAERDFFKALVEDPTVNVDFLPYYKIRYQEFDDKVTNYKKLNKYRQNFVDIFSQSLAHELLNTDNLLEIQHFQESKLYNVEVESLGNAEDVFVSGDLANLPTEKDPNLKCEWDETIEKVLVYRTDGKMTQAGDFGYCKYTLTLKSDPSIKSIGLIQTQFVNIAPLAKNDEFVLKWGSDQRVKIDVLANDNDDGDGTADQPFYPADKKTFYTTPEGITAPIKFSKIDSNLTFEAQYEAPCPDESGATCYGGDIYVKAKNNFNKFNYSFTYEFYDADASASNTASVRLINTATTSDDTRKGGGGAIGIIGLVALAGLAHLRRKKF